MIVTDRQQEALQPSGCWQHHNWDCEVRCSSIQRCSSICTRECATGQTGQYRTQCAYHYQHQHGLPHTRPSEHKQPGYTAAHIPTCAVLAVQIIIMRLEGSLCHNTHALYTAAKMVGINSRFNANTNNVTKQGMRESSIQHTKLCPLHNTGSKGVGADTHKQLPG